MKTNFDHENNCENYTCSVCGYTYTHYYDYEKQVDNEEKPFVKFEGPLLHVVSGCWEPDRIEKISQYACPVCGVLQIDTGVL